MNILLLLIPISLALLGVAIWAFFWAVRKGQFEDLDTPAIDILRDDPHDRIDHVHIDGSRVDARRNDEQRDAAAD